jgi:Protein of unknown function (DUF3300)
MNKRKFSMILWVGAALLLTPWKALAQGTTALPAAPPQAATQAAPVFKPEELDQILAPIALYPDDLLAPVLMASTYPLEIVQAERWTKDPKNAALKGEQLAAALEKQTWDPSVKSLVPFPQVLQMMSEQLDWTQKLGDAVLAQQKDVMTSIQRLRQKAQAADQLKTMEQQVVTTDTQTQTIVIKPANPQVVYVPAYNPTVVYGGWPYPAYPPYYYPPSPLYYPGQAFFSGMAFAAGVAVVGSLWGWGSCNWGGGDVNVNVNRYNNINRNNIRGGRATTLPANSNRWRHDPAHRGGAAYRDAGTRQQYLGQRGTPSINSRDFRGYSGGQGGTALGQGGGVSRGQGSLGQGSVGQGSRGQGSLQGGASSRQRPGAGTGSGNRGGQYNALGDFGSKGSTINRQANRGAGSRQGSMQRWGGGSRGGARGGRR